VVSGPVKGAQRINAVVAITYKGILTYDIYRDNMNGDKFAAFLKKLGGMVAGQKVALFMDNLSSHKTRACREVIVK